MKINNLRINGKCFKYNKYKIQKKLNELYKYDSFISFDQLLFEDYNDKSSINHRNSYNYIITNDLNKHNFRQVYNILMNGLIDNNDLINTSYYRRGESYMQKFSPFGNKFIKNSSPNILDKSMDELFEYLDNSQEDEFIKSQILHLYIILLQPYYDGNSRMGRISSVWNMINTGNINYISYIKGLFVNKGKYYSSINESKINLDITSFLDTMLDINILEKRKDILISEMQINYNEDSLIRLLYGNILSFQELVRKIRFSYGRYDYDTVNYTLASLKDKNIISITNNKIKIK